MKVMRPRITTLEATLVLECLKAYKGEIQKLIERREWLKAEVQRLRKEAFWNAMVVLSPEWKSKREELRTLEAEGLRLHYQVSAYESLIHKYETVVSGTKRKGRYRGIGSYHNYVLSHAVEKEPKTP